MAEVIDLKNIDYLATINKKTVFDNEQSSLTLLSFKAGVERSIHVDEKDEVTQITVGKEVFRLTSGEMIVMPALTPHGLKAVQNTKMLLLRPKHTHNK